MFDKFLTLKNKMKCGTIFYFTMSVSHYHLQIMRKRCYFMFIQVTRKKIKSSLLHCGKRGILYQFHVIYITLKYYFEGKVDLTYSDFSFYDWD